MNILLSEVLQIFKSNQVDDFLKKYSGLDLNEKNLKLDDIRGQWKFLGNNESNGSSINMLKDGEKGLIERLTNGVDAVIESKFKELNLAHADSSLTVIKKAFPKYYEEYARTITGKNDSINVRDAENQVILAINDGTKSNKPTFDILDKGTGIHGERFCDTILSIAKGNKLSSEKSYLIGAFGQGGSTSLPFTYATIIISKFDGNFYFTICKQVELKDFKNVAYVYLTNKEGKIFKLENDCSSFDEIWINDFINIQKSGTLIRMVETDISINLRNNEITKPGKLCDYINTQLFNVALPIKIIENRKDYKLNKNLQNRNACGSFCKLQTWSYVRKEYSGTMEIVHKNVNYKLNFFVILPKDESKWGVDSECEKVFEQFNVTGDPIIYTINGQMVSSEKSTKLNNAGLQFLKHRLLVVIDLDVLGTEKYRFVTSDRAQIKNTDLTIGFIDNVVKKLSTEQKLIEINKIISDKAIDSSIDKSLLDEIANEIKKDYTKFLTPSEKVPSGRGKKHGHDNELSEDIFEDEIKVLDLDSPNDVFYNDQQLYFILNTKAKKYVNHESTIDLMIDNKSITKLTKSAMNGRIAYTIDSGQIKSGNHICQCFYYKNKSNFFLESNIFNFEILDKKSPDKIFHEAKKKLDLQITIVNQKDLICDIAKQDELKQIRVYICWDVPLLQAEVFNNMSSSSDIDVFKKDVIKSVALFALFLNKQYDDLDPDKKNTLIINYLKSLASSRSKQ